MAAAVPCFWLEPTGQFVRFLRVFSSDYNCATPGAYCDARHRVGPVPAPDAVSQVYETHPGDLAGPQPWPTACARCGRAFHVKRSQRQVFHEREYRVAAAMPGAALAVGATCWTGQGPAIAGALWDAPWMGDRFQGPDGRHLMAMLPNGREWLIDGQANNCTKPEDRAHRCWIRHGEPPNITVDKRGNTCSAGAGSIQAGDYHGFLRAGQLVD